MIPHTNILYDTVGAAYTGDTNGTVFAFQLNDSRTHRTVSALFSAGSGTILVQGRNDVLSPWADLWTFVNTDTVFTKMLAKMRQMRVVVSGAVALEARVTTDYPGKAIS